MSQSRTTKAQLMLIDIYALFYRAFYALPSFTTSDGQPTGALHGIATMLLRLLDEEKPQYVAVAFDAAGPTFRHEMYEQYKAQRTPTPDELQAQIPYLRELISALGLARYEYEGYEADDIIGTLAKLGEEAGCDVAIVSGDKDLLQLVTPSVDVMLTRRGITQMQRYTEQDVQEQFGVRPDQFVDYKGLVGDTSDNIPGVPGIGPKTAERLLQQYETLDNVLHNMDDIKGRAGNALREHSEQARLSRKLSKIAQNVPLTFELEQAQFASFQPELIPLLNRLELARVIEEMQKRFPHMEGVAASPVEQEERDIHIATYVVTADNVSELAATWPKQQGEALLFVWSPENKSDFYFDVYARAGLIIAVEKEEHHFDVYVIRADVQPAVGEQLTNVLSASHVTWIAYDAKAVRHWLQQRNMVPPSIAHDLLLGSYVLDPERGDHSVSYIANHFVNTTVSWPGEMSSGDTVWDEVARVAGPAGAALLRAYSVMKEQWQEHKVEKVYRTVELPLTSVLTSMEQSGIAVDARILQQLSDEMSVQLEQLTQSIYTLAGKQFNMNSPKQLAEVLFDDLDLPVQKRTKTGPSTDAEVLAALADKHPIVQAVLDYRQIAKLKNTYIDALPDLIHPATQRIHTTFRQAMTATGRLASAQPNLQNIPIRTPEGRKIRAAFVPGADDYVLFTADYSQIELRVLAHISEDPNLIEAFCQQQDIHTKTASEIFDEKEEDVTPAMREAAKAVNFGIVYGISSYGLARDTGFSRAEAQQYIDTYFARYPQVKHYMDCTVQQAEQDGYVTTLFGRKRWLPHVTSKNWRQRSFAQRAAINTPIQGSAADIIKKAMVDVCARLHDTSYRAKLLLQVHDELVFEVHRDDVVHVTQIVQEAMEHVVTLHVPLCVDMQAGDNWLAMEAIQRHA